MPSIDLDLGFYQIAKYNYFPGWHQQASIGELLMNEAQWNALSAQQKRLIEVAANDSIQWSFVRSEALQYKAMQELQSKGVTLKRWPDSFLAAFREKWDEVVAEQSAKDPLFKEVADSYNKFNNDYQIWFKNAYMR